MNNIALIGIGNTFRGDDGAGLKVAEDLMSTFDKKVDVFINKGDIFELLDIFQRYNSVFLVDACSGDDTMGSWKKINPLVDILLPDSKQSSTHALNINQTIALAKSLHQLPKRLILYAIKGKNFQMNTSLSPEVREVLFSLKETIIEDIHSCMKNI